MNHLMNHTVLISPTEEVKGCSILTHIEIVLLITLKSMSQAAQVNACTFGAKWST